MWGAHESRNAPLLIGMSEDLPRDGQGNDRKLSETPSTGRAGPTVFRGPPRGSRMCLHQAHDPLLTTTESHGSLRAAPAWQYTTRPFDGTQIVGAGRNRGAELRDLELLQPDGHFQSGIHVQSPHEHQFGGFEVAS